MNDIQVDVDALPEHLKEWVNYEIAESNRLDVAVHLLRKKTVPLDGVKCVGTFDESGPILTVACYRPLNDWLQVLVHESCHRDQWSEQAKVWTKKFKGDDPLVTFHEWLEGRVKLTAAERDKMLAMCAAIELDCEMRSVEKIKEFELPFDICEYRKRANAYVYFYLAVAHTKRWYKRPPHATKEVWQYMPNDFDNDYTKLPRKYRDLIIDNCF